MESPASGTGGRSGLGTAGAAGSSAGEWSGRRRRDGRRPGWHISCLLTAAFKPVLSTSAGSYPGRRVHATRPAQSPATTDTVPLVHLRAERCAQVHLTCCDDTTGEQRARRPAGRTGSWQACPAGTQPRVHDRSAFPPVARRHRPASSSSGTACSLERTRDARRALYLCSCGRRPARDAGPDLALRRSHCPETRLRTPPARARAGTGSRRGCWPCRSRR